MTVRPNTLLSVAPRAFRPPATWARHCVLVARITPGVACNTSFSGALQFMRIRLTTPIDWTAAIGGALSIALGASPAGAQHGPVLAEGGWESRVHLSAMVTYQWGGSITTEDGRLIFDAGENFAGVLTFPIRPGARGELYYGYQPTTLRREQAPGVPESLAPMKIHYFQLGGRFEPVRGGRLLPYFAGTAGAVLFDAGKGTNGLDYGSDLEFAFRFAVGTTAVLTRRVGIRAEAGLLLPIFWSGGGFVCGGEGCEGVIAGSLAVVQGTVGGGLTIAF